MAKVQKDTTFLVSSAGSGYFYTNRKNKKKSKGEGKLSFKKYDPVARKHVLFEEKKLSKLSKKFVPGQELKAEPKGKDKAAAKEKSPEKKEGKKSRPQPEQQPAEA